MQAFRLKNFPNQDLGIERRLKQEKFYAKPGGLELAGTKDKTLYLMDFWF